MLNIELSLSGFFTAPDQETLLTPGKLLNISALDPLLPTLLITTLCLCVLSVLTYHSLALAWEVFWASRWSPSPLDPSAEVVLTVREKRWEKQVWTNPHVFFFWVLVYSADVVLTYVTLHSLFMVLLGYGGDLGNGSVKTLGCSRPSLPPCLVHSMFRQGMDKQIKGGVVVEGWFEGLRGLNECADFMFGLLQPEGLQLSLNLLQDQHVFFFLEVDRKVEDTPPGDG